MGTCQDCLVHERAALLEKWAPVDVTHTDYITYSTPSAAGHDHGQQQTAITTTSCGCPQHLRIYGFVKMLQIDAYLGLYDVLDHQMQVLARSNEATGQCCLQTANLCAKAVATASLRNSFQQATWNKIRLLHGSDPGLFCDSCMPLYIRFRAKQQQAGGLILPSKSFPIVVVGTVSNALPKQSSSSSSRVADNISLTPVLATTTAVATANTIITPPTTTPTTASNLHSTTFFCSNCK